MYRLTAAVLGICIITILFSFASCRRSYGDHPPKEEVKSSIKWPEISEQQQKDYEGGGWASGWTHPSAVFFKNDRLYIDAFTDIGMIAAIATADNSPAGLGSDNFHIRKDIIDNGLKNRSITIKQKTIELHKISIESKYKPDIPYENLDLSWSISPVVYQYIRLTIGGWTSAEVESIKNNNQQLLVIVATRKEYIVYVMPIQYRD